MYDAPNALCPPTSVAQKCPMARAGPTCKESATDISYTDNEALGVVQQGEC